MLLRHLLWSLIRAVVAAVVVIGSGLFLTPIIISHPGRPSDVFLAWTILAVPVALIVAWHGHGRPPRFRIRTLMIVVAIVALVITFLVALTGEPPTPPPLTPP